MKTKITIKLPRYTTPIYRPTGKIDFVFQVPKRLRPEGWPASTRLPIHEADRTRTGSPEEIAVVILEAKCLNDQLDEMRKAESEGRSNKRDLEPHGTLDWLMADWQEEVGGHWAGIKPKTRTFYQQGWDHIGKWSKANKKPHISRIGWPTIFKLVSLYQDRPAVQRQVRNVLQTLFQRALDKGIIEKNPWDGQKRRRWNTPKKKQEFRQVDYNQVLEIIDICIGANCLSMAQAVAVAFDTMQYPADIIQMKSGVHYDHDAGVFEFDRQKTGVPAKVPASPKTRELLGARDNLFLINYEGTRRPYKRDHFNKVWRRCIDGSAYEGFQFKWLRHSAVAEADQAGCSEEQLDSMGAWKPGGSGKVVRDQHYRQTLAENARTGMAAREAFRVSNSARK